MSRIEVRHVTHEYAAGDRRITALQDVSFTVGASESVCVLGQSGCGKTPLLNLLAGAPPRSTRAITGSRSSTTVKRSANSAASAETTSQPPR